MATNLREQNKTYSVVFILWKIHLLVRTELIITLRPGSVMTMSEAPLATLVASATASKYSVCKKRRENVSPIRMRDNVASKYSVCKKKRILLIKNKSSTSSNLGTGQWHE
jgi:hypothetical protein